MISLPFHASKQAASPQQEVAGLHPIHRAGVVGLQRGPGAPGVPVPLRLACQRSSPAHIHLPRGLSVGGHDPGGHAEHHTVLENRDVGKFLQGVGTGGAVIAARVQHLLLPSGCLESPPQLGCAHPPSSWATT